MSRETRVLDPYEVKFLSDEINIDTEKNEEQNEESGSEEQHDGSGDEEVENEEETEEEIEEETEEEIESDSTTTDKKLKNFTPDQISELVTRLEIEESLNDGDIKIKKIKSNKITNLIDSEDSEVSDLDHDETVVPEIKKKGKAPSSKEETKLTTKGNKQGKSKLTSENDATEIEEPKPKGRNRKGAPMKEEDSFDSKSHISSGSDNNKETKQKRGRNNKKQPEDVEMKIHPFIGKKVGLAKPIMQKELPPRKMRGKRQEPDKSAADSGVKDDSKSKTTKVEKGEHPDKEEDFSESKRDARNKPNKAEKVIKETKEKAKPVKVKSKAVDDLEMKEPEAKETENTSGKTEKSGKGKLKNATVESKENKNSKNEQGKPKDSIIQPESLNQRPKRNAKKADYTEEKIETKVKREVRVKKPLQVQGNPRDNMVLSASTDNGKTKTQPNGKKTRKAKEN